MAGRGSGKGPKRPPITRVRTDKTPVTHSFTRGMGVITPTKGHCTVEEVRGNTITVKDQYNVKFTFNAKELS